MEFKQHRQIGQQLREVRRTFTAVIHQLNECYGEKSGETQHAIRVLNSIENLRRTLNDTLRTEKDDFNISEDCYFALPDTRRR